MQPPLTLGTCLQNRYQLIRILGQGGFGRTYLATDQGRFNERCAIKEWIPPLTSQADFDKSRELFQREATILYQIHHPQIPEFQAIFEQDQRLFIVQDYVDGETYRALLDAKLMHGQTFDEPDVLQLLMQILPVLGYLHDQGIIHRDISPDNIILRSQDQQPVLIDFGVVKEVVTQLQATGTQIAATTVGKLGYAPSEQLQTGRAYPNSDLYALAVTTIVLLTGREPQDLFDDQSMTWEWHSQTSVRPSFAHVLNRMLSFRPNDRFRSAAEVSEVLQAVAAESGASPIQPTVPSPSTLQTIAVGGRREFPAPAGSGQTVRQSLPVLPPHSASRRNVILAQPSFWENPWIFVPLAILVALASGFGAWMVVGALLQRPTYQRSPQPDTSTTAEPTLDPNGPLLSPKAAVPQSVRLVQLALLPGEPMLQSGVITAPVLYGFTANADQILDVTLQGEGVRLTLLGSNQEPVSNTTTEIKQWRGQLPSNGNYTLRLSLAPGISQSDYQLQVTLSDPVIPTPTPTESSPSPEPLPTDLASPTTPPTLNPEPDTPPTQLTPNPRVNPRVNLPSPKQQKPLGSDPEDPALNPEAPPSALATPNPIPDNPANSEGVPAEDKF